MDHWRLLAVMILLRAMQDSIGNGLALGGSNTNGKRGRVIDGGKEWLDSEECDLYLKGLGYPWNRYSAHCGNERFKKYSIPVAVHGDFTSESPSVAQLKALKCVTDTLEEWVGEAQGKPQPLPIVRHKDIVNTACPGNLYEKYREFINK